MVQRHTHSALMVWPVYSTHTIHTVHWYCTLLAVTDRTLLSPIYSTTPRPRYEYHQSPAASCWSWSSGLVSWFWRQNGSLGCPHRLAHCAWCDAERRGQSAHSFMLQCCVCMHRESSVLWEDAKLPWGKVSGYLGSVEWMVQVGEWGGRGAEWPGRARGRTGEWQRTCTVVCLGWRCWRVVVLGSRLID